MSSAKRTGLGLLENLFGWERQPAEAFRGQFALGQLLPLVAPFPFSQNRDRQFALVKKESFLYLNGAILRFQ